MILLVDLEMPYVINQTFGVQIHHNLIFVYTFTSTLRYNSVNHYTFTTSGDCLTLLIPRVDEPANETAVVSAMLHPIRRLPARKLPELVTEDATIHRRHFPYLELILQTNSLQVIQQYNDSFTAL